MLDINLNETQVLTLRTVLIAHLTQRVVRSTALGESGMVLKRKGWLKNLGYTWEFALTDEAVKFFEAHGYVKDLERIGEREKLIVELDRMKEVVFNFDQYIKDRPFLFDMFTVKK